MQEKLEWKIGRFDDLTIYELYAILKLRSEVFVVDQDAVYLDPDDKDQIAIHVQGYCDNKLVAYCRLFKAGDYFEQAGIGRVVGSLEHRGQGFGHQLMRKALEVGKDLLHEEHFHISAQLYLQGFYEQHGFVRIGEVYDEDGIPHIAMER